MDRRKPRCKNNDEIPKCLLRWKRCTRHHALHRLCRSKPNPRYGCKMMHNAPNTSSSIVSKSISKDGGEVNYRGQVTFAKTVRVRSLISNVTRSSWTNGPKSDTIPFNEIHNSQVSLEHEAKVSKISEEQLYYLMSRGLTESEATGNDRHGLC